MLAESIGESLFLAAEVAQNATRKARKKS